MKYDDASWHYGGTFPSDLPREAGAIHIAIFLNWCLLHGMIGELHTEDSTELLERLRGRSIPLTQFLIDACDEKFTDEDLNDEGNAFARAYYGEGGSFKAYIDDYEKTLGTGFSSLYSVPNTWDSFDRMAPVIEARYQAWKASEL